MTEILIKKKFEKILTPEYATTGSSGMDISAYLEKPITIEPGKISIISTGFSLSIPQGFEIQIRPRSGLAAKKGITVLNTPGTIDSDYTGELKIILINLSNEKFIVNNEDRIAQMVVCPVIQAKLKMVKELPETTRGAGGFGSTGIK